MIFSLFPPLFFLWLAADFSWAALGATVRGRFTYVLDADSAGGPPVDRMRVEYRLGDALQVLDVSVDHAHLRQLGMPDAIYVVPGTPLLAADVPVRVLQVGGFLHAEPLFPWTWVWKRLWAPLAATVISFCALVILHGELWRVIPRSYRLVQRGQTAGGTLAGTHETGWWASSGEYSWTYIRRCYVDYVFVGPDGREHRGCQLVLGALDPARWNEGHPVTVLYDPQNFNAHAMYEACAFRARDERGRAG